MRDRPALYLFLMLFHLALYPYPFPYVLLVTCMAPMSLAVPLSLDRLDHPLDVVPATAAAPQSQLKISSTCGRGYKIRHGDSLTDYGVDPVALG